MERVRILIANHHPIIRGSLRAVLERNPEFEVIGEAATGQEAIAITEFRHPHVVLLEVKLPQLSGMAVATKLRSSTPPRPLVIFVSALADETYIERALEAGAVAYVLGDSAAADLTPAILAVRKGSVFLSHQIVSNIIREHTGGSEWASGSLAVLFSLVASGLSDQEVAERLGLGAEEIGTRFLQAKTLLADLGVSPVILRSIVLSTFTHLSHQA